MVRKTQLFVEALEGRLVPASLLADPASHSLVANLDGGNYLSVYPHGNAMEAYLWAKDGTFSAAHLDNLSSLTISSTGGDSVNVLDFYSPVSGSETWNISLGDNSYLTDILFAGVSGHLSVSETRGNGGAAVTDVGSVRAGASMAFSDTISGASGLGAFSLSGPLNGSLSVTHNNTFEGPAQGSIFVASVYASPGSSGSFQGQVNGNHQGGQEVLGLQVFGDSIAVTASLTHGPDTTVIATPNVDVRTY